MQKILFTIEYGSRLYGTATPTSDTDKKAIYLPELDALLLGKKSEIYKARFDAEGNTLGVNDNMPANGVETEFIPLQTFVRDYLNGQTYALETAHAYRLFGESGYMKDLANELIAGFTTSNVKAMTGFAAKQTFDYVKRGERLNAAKKLLEILSEVPGNYTLDEVMGRVAEKTGLNIVPVEKPAGMRGLELNGRVYLETTKISHLVPVIQKLIDSYGERSITASLSSTEWKSMSHAIRVYQQAIELLQTGRITFPRPNAVQLLEIKEGKIPGEEVKQLLSRLEAAVESALITTHLPEKTPELSQALEEWLLKKLRELYSL